MRSENTALAQLIQVMQYDGWMIGNENDPAIDYSVAPSLDSLMSDVAESDVAEWGVKQYNARIRYKKRQQRRDRQAEREQAQEAQAQQLRNAEILQHKEHIHTIVNRLLDVWDTRMLGRRFRFSYRRRFRIDCLIFDLQHLHKMVTHQTEPKA